MIKEEYKYSEITEKIIGCAFKVHSKMGTGYQEIIYQRCLEIELKKAGLSVQTEVEIVIFYDNIEVGKRRVDFLIENRIVVEIKAITTLENVHLAQALNYLEAFKLEVGLLLNFGSKSLEVKRLINQFK